MPTSTQSIREIVSTQPSAAKVFERFNIDLCLQADKSLDGACAELQLSVDQLLEKLADAETQHLGAPSADYTSLSNSRLIQHIVRVHHQCVRQEMPRLAEMAQKLAVHHGDRVPALKKVALLTEELRNDLFNHIQKEELILFPFIAQMEQEALAGGEAPHACFHSVAQPISMMMQEHDSADRTIAEVRRLTQGFESSDQACGTHIAFSSGLRAFEDDLKQHVHLESDLLFPRAIKMEVELHGRG